MDQNEEGGPSHQSFPRVQAEHIDLLGISSLVVAEIGKEGQEEAVKGSQLGRTPDRPFLKGCSVTQSGTAGQLRNCLVQSPSKVALQMRADGNDFQSHKSVSQHLIHWLFYK